jgi:hypothetical protein
VAATDAATIELRVPDYRGNIRASADLSHFTEPVRPGRAFDISTAAGRLETFAEGATQVFRITLSGPARDAERFYYADGAVRPVPR